MRWWKRERSRETKEGRRRTTDHLAHHQSHKARRCGPGSPFSLSPSSSRRRQRWALSLAHSPRLSRSHPAHTAAKSGSRTVNHHRRCLPAQHLGRVGIGGTTVAVVNLLVLLTSSVQQFSVLLSTPFLIDLLLTQNRSEALDIRRAHVISPLNS